MAQPNGTAPASNECSTPVPSELRALEADINRLASLISDSNCNKAADGEAVNAEEIREAEEAAGDNLAVFLEKLNSADGLAGEVEGKLDELLSKLDGMLAQLEDTKKEGDAKGEDDDTKSAS